MGDIKNVIGYLCKYVNVLLEWNDPEEMLKPEHIRLAKFNKTDQNTVQRLWRLLYGLIHPKLHLNNNNIISDIDQVKLNFVFHKYQNLDFYALEESTQESRELLLAFAWLISSTDVLKQIIVSRISTSTLNNEFPVGDGPDMLDEQLKFSSDADNLEYISVLFGKINMNIKICNDYEDKTISNMNKIHEATKYDLDIPHLSVNDVYIANNQALQDKFLEENSSVIKLLEAKSKWEECQSIFWKWMNTVLNDKLNDVKENVSDRNENLLKFSNLLKKQAHLPISAKLTNQQSSFHSGCVERHVYCEPKPKNMKNQSKTEVQGSTFKDTECNRLLENWENIEKMVSSLSKETTEAATNLKDKINSLVQEKNLRIF